MVSVGLLGCRAYVEPCMDVVLLGVEDAWVVTQGARIKRRGDVG